MHYSANLLLRLNYLILDRYVYTLNTK